MAFSKIKYLIKKRLFNNHFSMLESSVIEINNVEELKKIFTALRIGAVIEE